LRAITGNGVSVQFCEVQAAGPRDGRAEQRELDRWANSEGVRWSVFSRQYRD